MRWIVEGRTIPHEVGTWEYHPKTASVRQAQQFMEMKGEVRVCLSEETIQHFNEAFQVTLPPRTERLLDINVNDIVLCIERVQGRDHETPSPAHYTIGVLARTA
jgi:hypothetical protein